MKLILTWDKRGYDEDRDVMTKRLFEAAHQHQTLHSLDIRDSDGIYKSSVFCIMKRCHCEAQSVKELTFSNCKFTEQALERLIQSTSTTSIDSLALEQVRLQPRRASVTATSFRNLQVKKLSLFETSIKERELLPVMMMELAYHPCIETLDLRGILRGNRAVWILMDIFLRQNIGPSDLNIHWWEASMLTEAFQHNTSVKTLRIASLRECDLVTFAQGLAKMSGLRTLYIEVAHFEKFTKPFFQALEQTMEQNTSLCKLCLDGKIDSNDEMITKHYLPKIYYHLATNVVGRHTLMVSPNVPLGLWAYILARSSTEANGIYFVLTEQPDVVLHQVL